MTRRATPKPHTSLLASGVALAIATASGGVRAEGWALERFEPTPAGDYFFASDFPIYNRPLALGIVGSYAREPLLLRSASPGGQDTAVIENMVVAHAQGTVSLLDRVGLSFSLPVSLYQSGQPGTDSPVRAYESGPVAGDIRVGARLRLAGQADTDPISLHVGGYLHLGVIPYNDRDHNVTDEELRGRVYVTLAGRGGPVRWSLTGGYHRREGREFLGTLIGDDVYASAALGFVADEGRLTIGPEVWASTVVDRAFETAHVNAEAILGINYLLGDTLLVGVGAGPGLAQGAGTPQVRGLVRVAYAPVQREAPAAPPPPPDADNDGVLDADDLCVNEPAGMRPDPARRGCPLRDQDGDTVLDNEDQCPTEPRGDNPDPAHPGCPLRDQDGDTVLDNEDQCPTTPRGEHPDPERPGCPDGDDDNDGVLNHADQCRAQHQGERPDPGRPGCPIPDRDNDSVPDPVDHCPDQPGAPHPDPNRNGCPGLVRVEGGQIRILRPVFFGANRDRILRRSFPVLQAVADALRASPEIRRVSIEGHTDDAGDDARNLDLSQRRANSVMAWLIQHGVDASRLEAHGYGETRPLVPNTTRDGRAANRRVEFRVIDPAPPAEAGQGAAAPAATP